MLNLAPTKTPTNSSCSDNFTSLYSIFVYFFCVYFEVRHAQCFQKTYKEFYEVLGGATFRLST